MRNVEFTEIKSFNLVLPLFNPHMQEFVCGIEIDRVPPIDAEAESWFIEALSRYVSRQLSQKAVLECVGLSFPQRVMRRDAGQVWTAD